MKRVLVICGIHTKDNAAWMDHMLGAFRARGWQARKWTYGYAWAILTRWQNPDRAKTLASLVEPGDVLLGHSNGCCLIWLAAQLGAKIGGAILLNPALDTNKVMPPQVKWVNLYTNRYDEAVKIARFFPAHPWGPQGRDGISVVDLRYHRVRTEDGIPSVHGHSDILSASKLPAWEKRIIDDAETRAMQACR